MKADGTDVKRLPGLSAYFARYSPDGRKLAYIVGRFPASDVFIANADGSDAKKFLPK